jgi:hypothetical protein
MSSYFPWALKISNQDPIPRGFETFHHSIVALDIHSSHHRHSQQFHEESPSLQEAITMPSFHLQSCHRVWSTDSLSWCVTASTG